MSVSDELCKVAELSLLVEALSVILPLSNGGSDILFEERLGIIEMEFDSVFKGSHTSDAVEIVAAVECTQFLSKEDSICTGLEISCEEPCESFLSDGSTDMVCGCSTSGSITVSMNI